VAAATLQRLAHARLLIILHALPPPTARRALILTLGNHAALISTPSALIGEPIGPMLKGTT
jgi:hypothetical protein